MNLTSSPRLSILTLFISPTHQQNPPSPKPTLATNSPHLLYNPTPHPNPCSRSSIILPSRGTPTTGGAPPRPGRAPLLNPRKAPLPLAGPFNGLTSGRLPSIVALLVLERGGGLGRPRGSMAGPAKLSGKSMRALTPPLNGGCARARGLSPALGNRLRTAAFLPPWPPR